MPEILSEGIRISDLGPLASVVAGVELAVNVGGQDYRITAGQLLGLFTESAPAALDTWLEVVAKLEDNDDAVAALVAALALKAPLTSPNFLGVPTVPTAAPGTNTTQASSTAFALAAASAITGRILQTQRQATGAVATTTSVIPDDDTIPQITEGAEFLSIAITPSNALNILEIEAHLFIANSDSRTLGAALFQNGIANALAAHREVTFGPTDSHKVVLKHRMTAGSTSPITFSVRAGPAGASTLTVNGIGGARRFGGVMNSFIEVKEIST